MNWIDVIARAPAKKPCLVAEHGTLSYGELLHFMRRIGGGFATRGWKQGQRVFVAAGDDRHLLCLALAALANGLVPVIADPASPPAAAAVLRQVADTPAAVLDAALAASWGWSASDPNLWLIRPEPAARMGALYRRLLRRSPAPQEGWFAELDGVSDGPLAWQPTGDAPAMVFFTSGTTSRPKGVELGHHAIAAHVATLIRQFGYDGGARILNLLPWHHVDGFIQGALVSLASGGTLHRPVQFRISNIQRIIDTLYSDRITHFVAVPTMLAIILRLADGLRDAFDTPDLRMVISTAGHLEEALWREFEARSKLKVVNVYGLTETVAGGLFSGPDEATRRVGTLGRPVDCLARIMDPQGREAGEGERGELWLSGVNLMRGYLGDPEGTSAVLGEGWLHTGDLAYRDGEGFFHFTGRLKNVLISGGHTVQPEEITAALKSHPGVAEAATIGMAHAELEEVAASAVVPAAGAVLDEAMMIEHCRLNLAAYKIPRSVVILKQLPYGPSGKVLADALRAIIAGERPAVGAGDAADRVLEIARRSFKSQIELSPASAPETTPGWDSMGHLEFVMALEAAFAIRMSSQDIMKLTSLAAAIEIAEAARHG
jgi:long-chain acyl-CoA synthetase